MRVPTFESFGSVSCGHNCEETNIGTLQLDQAVCCGSTGALAKLFSFHRDRFAILVRFRLDQRVAVRVDVDDVLQEAFLEATKRIRHFQNCESMSPFVRLRAIVLQTLTDIHRSQLTVQGRSCNREFQAFGVNADNCLNNWLIDSLTSPSGVAIRDEQSQQLSTAINELNSIDREILVMRHFEDLSNQEVAEILEIAPATASQRYVRAIKRLRDVLNETSLGRDS